MEILIALLVLGVIVLIHELGHFLSAKFFKMPVKEFAIGMGPTVYSYEGNLTTYSFRAIPIGGFVSIDGMEVDSTVEDGFNTKPAYQRFIVLFAGVFMNFLLAFLIIFSLLMINGKPVQKKEAIIGNINKESLANNLLMIDDKIIKINDSDILYWNDISKALETYTKQEDNTSAMEEKYVNIELLRNDEKKEIQVPLMYSKSEKKYYLGIIPSFTMEKFSFISGIKASSTAFINIFSETLGGFKMLITGKVNSEEISGPLGIIKVVGEASKGGVSLLLWLTTMLSVNIGIFNLLPFPALDGGRIIFVILEMFKIKVNKKIEERIHTAGMIVLFAVIIYITGNDIFNFTK
ncbi:MAG: M50 family metallopeptidase [Fusobacteriaceae bacterium]